MGEAKKLEQIKELESAYAAAKEALNTIAYLHFEGRTEKDCMEIAEQTLKKCEFS